MIAWAGVHAAAALAALGATVLVLARRERFAEPAWLATATAASAVWSAHLVWFRLDGPSDAQLLSLPASSLTVGAMLLSVRALAQADPPHRRLLAVLVVAEPAFFVVFQPLHAAQPALDRVSPVVYGLHVTYCFAVLCAIVLALAVRSAHRSTTVRLQALCAQAGATLSLAVQALDLGVTDVVAAVALAGFVALGTRGDPAPVASPERLLDDLGVVVLVVDDRARLVDWNRPAGLLAELVGRPARRARPLAEIAALPADARPGDDLIVEVALPTGPARFAGHLEALALDDRVEGRIVVLQRLSAERAGASEQPGETARAATAPVVAPRAGLRLLAPPSPDGAPPDADALVEALHGAADLGPRTSQIVVVGAVGAGTASERTALLAAVEQWADARPDPVGVCTLAGAGHGARWGVVVVCADGAGAIEASRAMRALMARLASRHGAEVGEVLSGRARAATITTLLERSAAGRTSAGG